MAITDDTTRVLRTYLHMNEQQITHLRRAREASSLAEVLWSSARALGSTHEQLRGIAKQLRDAADRTEAWANAEEGQQLYPMQQLGQTAADHSRLVATEAAQAQSLQHLGMLWAQARIQDSRPV